MLSDILEKKLVLDEEIFKYDIRDPDAKKIINFYNKHPFPNYKKDENITDLIFNTKDNIFIKELIKLCDKRKRIAEFGSGTSQLSNVLASRTNSYYFALDATLNSLKLGKDFAKRNYLKNISFINADIFDKVFKKEVFDVIISNGVLHHTKNPYLGFVNILDTLKKDGYIIIGLYNFYGRIKNYIYKIIYRIFGFKIVKFVDPILKKKKDDQIIAWLEDQFNHPIETTHTFDEVLKWFKKNDIEFISSIPNLSLFDKSKFEIKKRGTSVYITRFMSQFKNIFNSFGSDGGLFIMVGKKR
tara:strand:- start:542 stop:1438 length:897 start_codon:yes stop_codon:yes gene_type:complete